ncbi:hypothetical protein RJ639_040652, partial [Escallonia herrerae]
MAAWRMNATKNQEAEFAYGAGHIDPVKATNPGLVYDTLKEDYIQMLCNLNGKDLETIASTSLVWSNGTHSVRSPIILHPDPFPL